MHWRKGTGQPLDPMNVSNMTAKDNDDSLGDKKLKKP